MGKSRVDNNRVAAREEIDARLDELEDFSFDADEAITEEEIDNLTTLICTFHLGRETRARFATLEQIERLQRALPTILAEHIPQVVKRYSESDSARSLIDCDLPLFLTSIAKLSKTRAQQSASGRGAFGRETVAQLRERNATLQAELAGLRQAQGAELEIEEEAS